MVTDCHTHLLPQRLARKVRGFFDQYLLNQKLAYGLDYDDLLTRHAAEGVTTVWNLPYAHKPGMAATLNASMLEVAHAYSDHPVRIVSGCTVHPLDDDPVEDLDNAVEAGARLLKLHCSVGEYELTDPGLAPVLSRAGELGIPVTVHAGHAVSGHTDAEELIPIAEAVTSHPETTFILAHCGHNAYEAAIAMMGRHRNLYCDLAPVIFEPVPLTAADAERFADRLLFGTDAPNTGTTSALQLDALKKLGLSDATYHAITAGNAEKLIPARR